MKQANIWEPVKPQTMTSLWWEGAKRRRGEGRALPGWDRPLFWTLLVQADAVQVQTDKMCCRQHNMLPEAENVKNTLRVLFEVLVSDQYCWNQPESDQKEPWSYWTSLTKTKIWEFDVRRSESASGYLQLTFEVFAAKSSFINYDNSGFKFLSGALKLMPEIIRNGEEKS